MYIYISTLNNKEPTNFVYLSISLSVYLSIQPTICLCVICHILSYLFRTSKSLLAESFRSTVSKSYLNLYT